MLFRSGVEVSWNGTSAPKLIDRGFVNPKETETMLEAARCGPTWSARRLGLLSLRISQGKRQS